MLDMANTPSVLVIVVLCGILQACWAGEGVPGVKQNDDGSGTISFSTPKLDDEDAHSLHMPTQLKCDACRIIAHMLYSKFDKPHFTRKNLKRLKETEIIDIVESVCDDKFENCGVKEIKGVKRLSGPGIETSDVPGVMQGGGKWPMRLQQMCHSYRGELGEDEIYEAYLEHKDKLEDYLCYGDGERGDCSTKPKQKRKKKNRTNDEL